ncbi:hypothetical protein P9209_18145 [Prescottella defluvii]|nr:hypothetical protein P9209_18145 [Prescottella defluvii]
MGQHRSDRRTRGVSKGPIIALVSVIVLVLGVVGWFQLRDHASSEGTAAAGACVEGDAVLHVTADPDIAPQIREFAARFSETRPVVRDHCVTVAVTDGASGTIAEALAAAPADRGTRPWVRRPHCGSRRAVPPPNASPRRPA